MFLLLRRTEDQALLEGLVLAVERSEAPRLLCRSRRRGPSVVKAPRASPGTAVCGRLALRAGVQDVDAGVRKMAVQHLIKEVRSATSSMTFANAAPRKTCVLFSLSRALRSKDAFRMLDDTPPPRW